MSSIPVHLLVAVFGDELLTKKAQDALKQAQRDRQIMLDNAAVLHKDERGKLHIHETIDMGGGKGAALGGVAEAAIGAIGGSALLVPAEVGALVGSLSARLRDCGFSDVRLKKLGEDMLPGSSAIVIVVEHRWLAEVEQTLAEAGGDVSMEALSADVAGQLEAGHKVAYSASILRQCLSPAQVVEGEDRIEGSQAVIHDNDKYDEHFVAAERGFAVVAMDPPKESLILPGQPSKILGEDGAVIEQPPVLAE